jgi:predicted MFS family arabinose efflux permease
VSAAATGGERRTRLLVPTLVLVAATTAVVSSLGAPLIPTIARSERVSLGTAQWVLTAALLVSAVVTPILGRLADGSRQRRLMLVCLALAFGGCVLVATAHSFGVIVVGRGFQGVGVGLVPVTMAMVRRHLPHDTAQRAIATLSISNIIGIGLGYPLSGFMAEAFGFHGAYWFGAITVGVSLTLAFFVLPTSPPMTEPKFDVLGGVVIALAITGLSVYLSEGAGWGWTSAIALGVLTATLLCIVWWVPHELRTSVPLIDLRQVKERLVLTADSSGLLICIAMYLFLPVIVEFAQVPRSVGFGFGTSIVVGGAILVPLSVGTFFAARLRAGYERRFGVRTMIPIGSLAFAISCFFFAFEHRALWEAFATMGLGGVGAGFTFAAMPGLVVRGVPPSGTGSALGFYQVLRSIGLSIGSALAAAILAVFTARGRLYPEVAGFRTALIVGGTVCLLTAVVSYVLPGAIIERGPGPASGQPDRGGGETAGLEKEIAETVT